MGVLQPIQDRLETPALKLADTFGMTIRFGLFWMKVRSYNASGCARLFRTLLQLDMMLQRCLICSKTLEIIGFHLR